MQKKLFGKKAENAINGQIIRIVIAIIMIFVLIAFGAQIWEALFPSADRASTKSFDALYSLINSKASSKNSYIYESTTLTMYLKDGYQLYYFGKNVQPGCSMSGNIKPVIRPTKCGTDGSLDCMCLYSSGPVFGDESKKDEKVLLCKTFKSGVVLKQFSILEKDSCTREGKFFSVIVSRDLEFDGSGKKLTEDNLYVWLNNDANRKRDAELKKDRCFDSGICSGKKAGDLLTGNDAYLAVRDACFKSGNPISAIEGKCVVADKLKHKCVVECTPIDCDKKITSCEAYANYLGAGKIVDFTSYFSSFQKNPSNALNNGIYSIEPGEAACKYDPCKLSSGSGGCNYKLDTSSTSVDTLYFSKLDDGSIPNDAGTSLSKCNIEQRKIGNRDYLIYYNVNDAACKKFVEDTFTKKSIFFMCGSESECDKKMIAFKSTHPNCGDLATKVLTMTDNSKLQIIIGFATQSSDTNCDSYLLSAFKMMISCKS